MKTMKLLPLKIAVTSAMIIGLGAASTANAQAQSGLTYLEQARGLIEFHYNNYDEQIQKLNLDRFKVDTFTKQQLYLAAMEELGESIDDLYEANEENVERIVTIDHAAAANRQNIQNLAKAQLAGVTVMEELDKKSDENAQKIENLRTLFKTRGRTVENNEKSVKENKDAIAKNKGNIQDLAKAQLAGVEVMTELNKNVEENKADIAKNNASIEDLYEYGQEVANSIGEIHDHNRQQNETLENLITNSTANTDNIAKNKADIQDLAKAQLAGVGAVEELNKNVEENKADIAKNKANIQDLAKAQLAGVGAMEELNKNVEENKAGIAANKADADAKFKGVQTDIANNKTTLAEHAKKINDNQQAIEAKLGGKADLQKLSELKSSVDKNQADIQLHDTKITNLATLFSWTTPTIGNNTKGVATNKADIAKNKDDIQNNINNIYELAQQQDQHSSDIKTLAKASSANTDNIAKNKADADASFKTLTKNQNALIEKDKAQDALITANKADADASFKTLTKNQNALIEKDKEHDKLITANKADADAKFKGVQTDIANNKTTLAQHTKKIDENQQAIEAKLGDKADLQKLAELKTSVDKNQAGIATNKQELIIQNNRLNRIDETNNRQDQKIDQLGYALKEQGQYFNSRISAVERQTAGGIANAIAIATLPSPNRAGEHHVLFGSGYHNGQAAVSLGAAGSSDTGKSTYKIGLSWSDAGGLSGGVGGSYRWK